MPRRRLSTATRLLIALALAVAATITPATAQERSSGPLVFAAASLKTALDAIAADWQKESGKRAVLSYAASSALARQIESGAPADIFISADLDWMDWLQQRKLIDAASRETLLDNSLVLVAPADSKIEFKIAPGANLAATLGNGRLAVGEVNSVPAGKYAKEALEKLGMWQSVANKLAPSPDVRSALNFVARGEAQLGIVYATDAKAEPRVKVVDTFPPDSHAPILYPAALTAASRNPDAKALLAYLRSSTAVSEFKAQGFGMVNRGK
jgi:molybdate transport system substrate-binding protein